MDVKIQKKIGMFLQHFSINNSRRQKVVGRVAPSICVIHLRGSFYLNVFESRGGGEVFLRSQLLIARRTSWYRTHGSRLTAPLTLVHSPLFCLPGTERGQTSHANTSCVLINCLQRLYAHEAVIEKWHSFPPYKDITVVVGQT